MPFVTCCLTHGSCHWPGLRSLLAMAMGASSITSPKNGWSAFICPYHLPMTCSGCWTSLCTVRPDSQILCYIHLLFVWLHTCRSRSDGGHMHVTACTLVQARPTMPCIHLVFRQGYQRGSDNSYQLCCYGSGHGDTMLFRRFTWSILAHIPKIPSWSLTAATSWSPWCQHCSQQEDAFLFLPVGSV